MWSLATSHVCSQSVWIISWKSSSHMFCLHWAIWYCGFARAWKQKHLYEHRLQITRRINCLIRAKETKCNCYSKSSLVDICVVVLGYTVHSLLNSNEPSDALLALIDAGDKQNKAVRSIKPRPVANCTYETLERAQQQSCRKPWIYRHKLLKLNHAGRSQVQMSW